jgi:hypothetical protein
MNDFILTQIEEKAYSGVGGRFFVSRGYAFIAKSPLQKPEIPS